MYFLKLMFLVIFFLFSVSNSYSQILFPEKKTQLYQTYGLFTEDGQVSIFNQGKSKFWMELSTKIAFLEFEEMKFHPQLIFHASIMDSLRYEKKEFQSDTQDLRAGVAALMTIDDTLRFLVSVTHLSGHVLEDDPSKILIPVNVGDEIIGVRVVKDLEDKFRMGFTFKYIFGTEGKIKRLIGDQFFEWHPNAESSILYRANPYVALGIEENGYESYGLSSHIQAGFYWGNHFSKKHSEIARVLLGYYSGLDPRQKYSHFLHSKAQFLYAGLAYEY